MWLTSTGRSTDMANTSKRVTGTDEFRFWSYVKVARPDDCWPWQGARAGGRSTSYGTFRVKNPRSQVYCHRYSLALSLGVSVLDLPRGKVVRHSCDTPLCCNPAHLSLGTQKENMLDMVSQGKQRKGEDAPGAKLTPEKVQEIRQRAKAGATHKSLALEFNVCRENITNIVNRKVWEHVA